jgi:hypothetical protein
LSSARGDQVSVFSDSKASPILPFSCPLFRLITITTTPAIAAPTKTPVITINPMKSPRLIFPGTGLADGIRDRLIDPVGCRLNDLVCLELIDTVGHGLNDGVGGGVLDAVGDGLIDSVGRRLTDSSGD